MKTIYRFYINIPREIRNEPFLSKSTNAHFNRIQGRRINVISWLPLNKVRVRFANLGISCISGSFVDCMEIPTDV